MPTGLAPLITAAKYGKDQLAQGTIETIIEGSTALSRLAWEPFEGLAYVRRVEDNLPNVHFRAVNAGYQKSFGSDTKLTFGVAILGGEHEVDNYITRVVANVDDWISDQIAKYAKANRMRVEYEIFHGTGADDGFAGFKEFVNQGLGQLSPKNSAGALDLDDLNDAIDLFRNTGSPDVMFVNKTHRRKITSLAQNTSGYFPLIEMTRDTLGQRVSMYDGIPMAVTEDGLDGSGNVVPLQDFDEPSSTSSIYMVKFNKDNVYGLLGAGGHFSVKRFGELQGAPREMFRIEWYPGLASVNKYGLVRIPNITNA